LNVFWAKFVDRYVGSALCLVLAPFRKRKTSFLRNVLFVQLWGLGETVCTLPAIKAFKSKYPKTEVAILATDRNAAVYMGKGYIDELIVLKPGMLQLLKFSLKNRNHFDLAIDLEEYLNLSAIVSFFVARNSIGYDSQLRSSLYTTAVPYNDHVHVAEAFMNLLRPLKINSKVTSLEPLAISKDSKLEAKKLLKYCGVSGNDFLVCIGIGTAESSKCRKWPVQNFAQIADYLIKDFKAKVVFVGSKGEIDEIDDTIKLMEHKALNLGGKTSTKGLFALLSRCKLFIGNDSGPMHVAAAQGVPTIGLFGPNLPQRFGPVGPKNKGIYKGEICKYSPCINVHKGEVPDCCYGSGTQDYQKCMKNIRFEDVKKAIREVMEK